MHNPLVEAELQDICAFRKHIIQSFDKINSHISHSPPPLDLNSHCNCTDQNHFHDPLDHNLAFGSFATSPFSYKPAQHSSAKNDFWSYKKSEAKSFDKNDRITRYLNEYDLNKFNFELQPLKERKIVYNQENYVHTQNSSKKYVLSDKLNNSALQVTKMPRSNQNISRGTRRTVSTHENCDQTARSLKKPEHIQVPESRAKSEIKQKNLQKENFLTTKNSLDPQKSTLRNHSFTKIAKTKRTKSRAVSSKGFLSHRQGSVSKPNRSKEEQMKQRIYKNIHKRIYLSLAAQKSAGDNFDSIYQKEQRERNYIVEKIVNDPKVIKRLGSVIPQNK